jgi:hypothetical protein
MKNLRAAALLLLALVVIVNTQALTSPCLAISSCGDCLAQATGTVGALPLCDFCSDTSPGKCIPKGSAPCTTVTTCPRADPCASFITASDCFNNGCYSVNGSSCASLSVAVPVFAGCVSPTRVVNATTFSFCGVSYATNVAVVATFLNVPFLPDITYGQIARVNVSTIQCCAYNPNNDPCTTVKCNQNQMCTNGQCTCVVGYAGTNCNIATCNPNANDTVQCGGNGACSLIADLDGTAYRCVCAQYYSGAQCEIYQLPPLCVRAYPNSDAVYISDPYCYCYFNPFDPLCNGCDPTLTYAPSHPCYCQVNALDFTYCCFPNTTLVKSKQCYCYFNPADPACCVNPVVGVSTPRCCLPNPSPLDQVCYCRAYPSSDICCNSNTAVLSNKACYCKLNSSDVVNCCNLILSVAGIPVCCDNMTLNVCKCAFDYYDNLALCNNGCNANTSIVVNKPCYCSFANRLITDPNCCNTLVTTTSVAVDGTVNANTPLCCDAVTDNSSVALKVACCNVKAFSSLSPLACKCYLTPGASECCNANTPYTLNPACFCNNYPENSLCCNSDVSYSVFPECYCRYNPTDDLCCASNISVVTELNLRCYCKYNPTAAACCSALTNVAYQCCNPNVTNYDFNINVDCFCKSNPDDPKCCNQLLASSYIFATTPTCFCILNPFDPRCCNDSAGRPCCDYKDYAYSTLSKPDCACRDPVVAASNPNCSKVCNPTADPAIGKPADVSCFCLKNPTSYRCCLADKVYTLPLVVLTDADKLNRTCYCLYNKDCRCDGTCLPPNCAADPSPTMGSSCYCKRNFNDTANCCPQNVNFQLDPRCYCYRKPTDPRCDPICQLTIDGVCDNDDNFCAKYPNEVVCFCKQNPTDVRCTNPCPVASVGSKNCSLNLYCRKNLQDLACKCILNPSSCSNWTTTPPPKGYCDNASVSDLDCFCSIHPHDDKCSCRLRPDSKSCYCVSNPTDVQCQPGNPSTVTVTANGDGSFTVTPNIGNEYVVKPRSPSDTNEEVNVTFTGDKTCKGVTFRYNKVIEFKDINSNNQVDPDEVVGKETTFDVDLANSDSGVYSGSSTLGGILVSNIGRTGLNIDIQQYLGNSNANVYGDATLNIPAGALETYLMLKNYVSSLAGSKVCFIGSICACPNCKISVDNVARIITVACTSSTAKVYYSRAYAGGTQVNVTVAVNATADSDGCYEFAACFEVYNAGTLLWDPFIQSSSPGINSGITSSTHHSDASTSALSYLAALFVALAYLFKNFI